MREDEWCVRMRGYVLTAPGFRGEEEKTVRWMAGRGGGGGGAFARDPARLRGTNDSASIAAPLLADAAFN